MVLRGAEHTIYSCIIMIHPTERALSNLSVNSFAVVVCYNFFQFGENFIFKAQLKYFSSYGQHLFVVYSELSALPAGCDCGAKRKVADYQIISHG